LPKGQKIYFSEIISYLETELMLVKLATLGPPSQLEECRSKLNI